jgi:hypothetical protein
MPLYEGPSLLNGKPIFAIATPDSNPKTGQMLYTYILLQEKPPDVAAYDGSDEAVCGDCVFRGPLNRKCYVRLSHEEGADEKLPPSEVWKKWKAGKFGNSLSNTEHLPVRIGSYGDPAAVPTEVWSALLAGKKHWTGYTHMWRSCDQSLQEYCMASVDNVGERNEAQGMGWRTFLVVPLGHADPENDILCPATDPHPKRNASCATCLLCKGSSSPAPSIWEIAHGRNRALI